jgi:hypothetical protein
MKFNLKKIAAAALLAAASLPSFAVINTTATNTSLVLYAFDINGSGATYYRDLGSVNQVLNATGNVSFAAPVSSIFASTFASVAAGDIYWGIAGADTASVRQTQWIAAGASAISRTVADIGGYTNGVAGTFGTFVALDTAGNGFIRPVGCTVNCEYTGNPGVSVDNTFATNAFDFANRATLNSLDLGVGVGSSLNLFKSTQPASGTAAGVTQINTAASGQAFLGGVNGGYFTLVDTSGNLSWTQAAAVAAVPLPAGALLLGPGLLAMLGFGRRRNKAA